MQTKRNKGFIPHFPSQAGVQTSPGKSGSIMPNSETNAIALSIPSFFLQLCMLSMIPYGLEYPLGQLRSAATAVSPPSSLCPPTPPSPLAGGMRIRMVLDSLKSTSQ